MKRKFYFHRQNAPLDTDHVIYTVWIGESVREQRILTQLLAWSFAHGATLRSWGEDVDYYLLLEAERVFPGRGLLDFGFIHTHINARDLQILMDDNAFEAYEAALTAPRNYFHQIRKIDPSKIREKDHQIVNPTVLSSQRKYLSQEAQNEWSLIRFV